MKKIIYFLAIYIGTFSFSSCVGDEKDIFDTPSLERLYKLAQEYNELLVSTGEWILDYYPEINQGSGGYTMIVKFNDDGTAAISCEVDTNIPAFDVAVSQYEMAAELGVQLKFNTYNEVLHYFCDPSSADVDGMAGDSEFILYDVTPELITLRGKKYYNWMYLRPLPSTETAAGYLAKIDQMRYYTGASRYVLTVKGKDYFLSNNNNRFVYNYLDEDGATMSISVPFVCTDTGIRLYKPYEVDGVVFENFVYDIPGDKLTSVENGTDIIFEYLPNVLFAETSDMWFFIASESHASIQETFNKRYTGTTWATFFVDDISIGVPYNTNYGSFGISVFLNNFNGWYVGIWRVTPTLGETPDEIILGPASGAYNAGSNSVGWYATDMLEVLESGDPYEIVVDDMKRPTKIWLNSKTDPAIYYALDK